MKSMTAEDINTLLEGGYTFDKAIDIVEPQVGDNEVGLVFQPPPSLGAMATKPITLVGSNFYRQESK